MVVEQKSRAGEILNSVPVRIKDYDLAMQGRAAELPPKQEEAKPPASLPKEGAAPQPKNTPDLDIVAEEARSVQEPRRKGGKGGEFNPLE